MKLLTWEGGSGTAGGRIPDAGSGRRSASVQVGHAMLPPTAQVPEEPEGYILVIISAAQEDQVVINVRINGQLVLSTPSDLDVIGRLEALGIRDPAPLVAGCRRWGIVEIHESPTPVRLRNDRVAPTLMFAPKWKADE